MIPPLEDGPDLRPRFRRAVHFDDLSDPKRPRTETRFRESIITPRTLIEATDRAYLVEPSGSIRRARVDGDQILIVPRRSRAKPVTMDKQRAAARIEAAIAKREERRDARRGRPTAPPSFEDLAAEITPRAVAAIRAASERGVLTGDPYADRKRIEDGGGF